MRVLLLIAAVLVVTNAQDQQFKGFAENVKESVQPALRRMKELEGAELREKEDEAKVQKDDEKLLAMAKDPAHADKQNPSSSAEKGLNSHEEPLTPDADGWYNGNSAKKDATSHPREKTISHNPFEVEGELGELNEFSEDDEKHMDEDDEEEDIGETNRNAALEDEMAKAEADAEKTDKRVSHDALQWLFSPSLELRTAQPFTRPLSSKPLSIRLRPNESMFQGRRLRPQDRRRDQARRRAAPHI